MRSNIDRNISVELCEHQNILTCMSILLLCCSRVER